MDNTIEHMTSKDLFRRGWTIKQIASLPSVGNVESGKRGRPAKLYAPMTVAEYEAKLGIK